MTVKQERISLALAFGGLLMALLGQCYINSLAGLSRHEVEFVGRPFRLAVLVMELMGVVLGARARGSALGRVGMIISSVLLLITLVLNRFDLLVFERL